MLMFQAVKKMKIAACSVAEWIHRWQDQNLVSPAAYYNEYSSCIG